MCVLYFCFLALKLSFRCTTSLVLQCLLGLVVSVHVDCWGCLLWPQHIFYPIYPQFTQPTRIKVKLNLKCTDRLLNNKGSRPEGLSHWMYFIAGRFTWRLRSHKKSEASREIITSGPDDHLCPYFFSAWRDEPYCVFSTGVLDWGALFGYFSKMETLGEIY